MFFLAVHGRGAAAWSLLRVKSTYPRPLHRVWGNERFLFYPLGNTYAASTGKTEQSCPRILVSLDSGTCTAPRECFLRAALLK